MCSCHGGVSHVSWVLVRPACTAPPPALMLTSPAYRPLTALPRGPGAPGGTARTPAALTFALLKPQHSAGRDGAATQLAAASHKFPSSFHSTTCSTAGGAAGDAGATLVVTGLVTSTTDASVETHGSLNGGRALQGSSGYGHLGSGAAAATEGVLGNPLLASGPQPHVINIPLNLVLGQDLIADRENVIGRGTFATVVHVSLSGSPACGGAGLLVVCIMQAVSTHGALSQRGPRGYLHWAQGCMLCCKPLAVAPVVVRPRCMGATKPRPCALPLLAPSCDRRACSPAAGRWP